MNEAKLFSRMKSNIPGAFTRIENSIGSGMFDVYGTYNGVGAWIELKVLYPSGYFLMRPLQFNWGSRQVTKGEASNLWLLAGNDKDLYLWNMRDLYQRREEFIPTSQRKLKFYANDDDHPKGWSSVSTAVFKL